MKSLNEIIAAYEKLVRATRMVSYAEATLDADALEYLKEYRELLDNVEANEPLEFITICGMVGKPVWIEYDNQSVALLSPPKRWAIVCTVDDDWNEISFCGKGNPFWLRADDFGIHWKAYRKERKCFS